MKPLLWILTVVALAVAAFLIWSSFAPPPAPPPEPPVQRIPVPPHGPDTGIAHPLTPAAPQAGEAPADLGLDQPLPPLDESDGRLQELLGRLLPDQHLSRFLVLDHIIRRFVLLVDSLPRSELPSGRLPTRPVAGTFLTTGSGDERVIDPANFRRYTPWISLAESADPKLVVAVYVYLYPLFQEAYRDLGYPTGYFNDRLIEVIDHLLATPEVSGPLRLVRPKIVYLFADPQLEARSAGQKILLRIGPKNAARVKALLRNYSRELLAATAAGPPSDR
jgi:Protein of unknown function (DUF3014)